MSAHETSLNQTDRLPSMEDLDLDVIMGLPSDLFTELNDMYGGKLNDLVSKTMSTSVDKTTDVTVVRKRTGEVSEDGKAPENVHCVTDRNEVGCCKNKELDAASGPEAGTETLFVPPVEVANIDLMPSSLSQVDISVLQQLPEELRADIVGALPAHRQSGSLTERTESVDKAGETVAGHQSKSMGFHNIQNIWAGNPPYWVNEFKSSSCVILNFLAERFLKSGSPLLCNIASLGLRNFLVYPKM